MTVRDIRPVLRVDEPAVEHDAPAVKPTASKATDERKTPQWLFDALDIEFRFSWDLAARAANAKVRDGAFFGLDHPREEFRDGLAVDWNRVLPFGSVAFCNPPYSRGSILKWCAKAEAAAAHAQAPLTTVMLLPGDISTEYWHRYVLTGERRTITTRLKFEGAPLDKKGQLPPAKFGSVLRIWRPTHRYWSFA